MSMAMSEWVRFQALEHIVAEQAQRIAALEKRLCGEARQPEPLRQHNGERVADAQLLRDAIRQLLDADAGPRRGAGKRVWRALADTDIGRSEQPSLRAVQWHIAQLRNTAALRT